MPHANTDCHRESRDHLTSIERCRRKLKSKNFRAGSQRFNNGMPTRPQASVSAFVARLHSRIFEEIFWTRLSRNPFLSTQFYANHVTSLYCDETAEAGFYRVSFGTTQVEHENFKRAVERLQGELAMSDEVLSLFLAVSVIVMRCP